MNQVIGINAAKASEPLAFRSSEALRQQARALGLTPLQADFVRYLALSAWLVRQPLRQIWTRPPSARPMLDTCLVAFLHQAGWPLRGADDPVLDTCWELRFEFVAANAGAAALYRPAPSYNERLRLELLIVAWQHAVDRPGSHAVTIHLLSQRLAEDSAAFNAHFALPVDLLLRAANERRSHPSGSASAVAHSGQDELTPRLKLLESVIWEPVGA